LSLGSGIPEPAAIFLALHVTTDIPSPKTAGSWLARLSVHHEYRLGKDRPVKDRKRSETLRADCASPISGGCTDGTAEPFACSERNEWGENSSLHIYTKFISTMSPNPTITTAPVIQFCRDVGTQFTLHIHKTIDSPRGCS
jgi:hypothetical protein